MVKYGSTTPNYHANQSLTEFDRVRSSLNPCSSYFSLNLDAEQSPAGEANEPSAPMTEGGIGQVLDAPEPDDETPTIEE